MADITATLGLDGSAFTTAVSQLSGSSKRFANQLETDFARLRHGQQGVEAFRASQLRLNNAQADTITNLIRRNEQERQAQAAQAQAVAAEKARLASIERITQSLKNQVNAIGRSTHEQQRLELATLGATDAQMKQVRAMQSQLAVADRLKSFDVGGAGKLMALGAGIGGVAGLTALSDEYVSIFNKLKLVHDQQVQVNSAFSGLQNIARSTGGSLSELSSIYQKLAQNSASLQLNQQDILALTDTIGKSLSISGGSTEASANAIRQFSQALDGGVMRAEEFNSVLENAPALAQAMARGLGMNVGALRQMMLQGELTSKKMVKALQQVAQSVNTDFDKTNWTIGNAFQALHDKMLAFVGSTAESSHGARLFGNSVLFVADNVDKLLAGFTLLTAGVATKWAISGLAGVAQFGAAMIASRAATVSSLPAHAALAASMRSNGAAMAIATFQVNSLSGSLAVLRASTVSATVAMRSFSAASVLNAGLAATRTAAYTAGGAVAGMAARITSPLARAGLAGLSLTAGISGVMAAVDVAKGRDASNIFSQIANSLVGLDGQTETIGTKLHDWFGNAQKVNTELEKSYSMMKAMSAYQSQSDAVEKAGGFAQFDANRFSTGALRDSINKTILKYKEQEEQIGKTTQELELMRLEAEKEAFLIKKRGEFQEQFKKAPPEQQENLIEQSMKKTADALNREIEQVRESMNTVKKAANDKAIADKAAAQAAKNREAVDNRLAEMSQKIAVLGKTDDEITQLDLAAQGATKAELEKISAMQETIRQYEKQSSVMKSLEEMQLQLDKIGKSATQIKLDDLRRAGATEAQLAQAKWLLEAIATKEQAQKTLDAASNKMLVAGDKMLSASGNHDDELTARIKARWEERKAQAQIDSINSELKRRQNEARERTHRVAQGGKSDDEWMAFSQARYGTDFFELTKEYKEAVGKLTSSTAAARIELDNLKQGVPNLQQLYSKNADGNSGQTSEITSLVSQLSVPINIFHAATNVFHQAANVLAGAADGLRNPPQVTALADRAVDMGTVVLDLRLPNGAVLAGQLFGDRVFLEKLKAETNRNITGFFEDVRTAVRS